MKILIFGLGSIGTRHARLIRKHYSHELYAYSRGRDKKPNIDIPVLSHWSAVEKISPDIAFICNPTSLHIETAMKCAELGIHLFLEKPISNTGRGLSDLLNLVRKREVTTYVAYCLRFHPVVVWLKNHLKENIPLHIHATASSYLPNWRENADHLKNYSAREELGGGAIFDLSHEIDYLYHLLGAVKKVKVNSRKQSDVTVDSEDFADILFEFESGCFGNLHLNFFSHLKRREAVLNFKNHTVVGDIGNNRVLISGKKKDTLDFTADIDEMYISQLKYFFSNIGNAKMMNNIVDAVKPFETMLTIKKQVTR